MAISRELIERILKSVNIVDVISSYIEVHKKGRQFVAVCPFHDDKNPSLQISEEKQIFKCFVDGTGGNAFDFVMAYEKVDFHEAVRRVAKMAGISDPSLEDTYRKTDPRKEPLYSLVADLDKYYRYCLKTAEGKAAMDYLGERGLGEEEIRRFGIGYAPLDGEKTISYLRAKGHGDKDIETAGIAMVGANMKDKNAGRLVFPLFDTEGRTIGFSARRLSQDKEQPKYVNTQETPIFHKGENLYNYHNAISQARKLGYLYVLEGFMDVIALSRAEVPGVALMGTALSKDQIQLLKKANAEIRLCLDGDAPGQEAMMRAITPLSRAHVPLRMVVSTSEDDPDDLFHKGGKQALMELLNNLSDPFYFQLNYYTHNRKLGTQEERRKVAEHFLPYIASLKAGIEREDAIERLSGATGYSSGAIRNLLGRYRNLAEEEEAMVLETVGSQEPKKPREGRLAKAERQILHYMLTHSEAVGFYEKNIDNLQTPLYQTIANYLVEYVYEHGEGPVEIASLLLDISSSGEEDSVKNEVASIAQEEGYPEYGPEALEACAKAIREEKEKAYIDQKAEALLSGKSQAEKAAALNDIITAKKKRLSATRKEKENV